MNSLKTNLTVKKAGIHIVLLTALVTICGGAVILSISLSGKYQAKEDYERIANRYIAESGADLAMGLFLNYLDNHDYAVQYQRNEDGSYEITDAYAPYLIDDIRFLENADNIPIRLVETEACDYLSSIGYIDFKRGKGISFLLNTFAEKDNFKLSQLSIDPGFVVSRSVESNEVESRINPLYADITVRYKGGEVICKVKFSDIAVRRSPFYPLSIGEFGSISAKLDTSKVKVDYINFQNYRSVMK